PDTRAVMRLAVVEQRLVEERDVARGGHQATSWKVHLAEFRFVHFQHHVLVNGVEVGARGCHAKLPILLFLGGFPDPFDIGHGMLDRTWQSDSQVGQSERLSDSLTHEFTEALSRDALDRICDWPIIRVYMIDELLTRRVNRTPLHEALQPPLAIAP